MQARSVIVSVLLCAALGQSQLQARPQSYAQSRFNGQLQCQDLAGVTAQLEQMVGKFKGQITNLNSDLNSGSGNLQVRIPEENLTEFTAALSKLGMITNQSRSLNDNTSSYQETKRQLESAEKMASAQWNVTGGQLNPVEKGLCEAEFKAYLRDRINSFRSTLASYEMNQGWAEVSLSLTGPNRRPVVVERSGTPTIVEEKLPQSEPAPRYDFWMGVPIVALLGFLSLRMLRLPKKAE